MTSRTKETSEEKSEKWASPHPREPWESPGSRDNRDTGSERRSQGWKKRTVSTVHKTSESLLFPSSSRRPEIGNLFSREIELKRLSTQGIKQARGKWGNWVENMGTKQKSIYKRVESLYTYSTLSQNPGRQLNFPLEILKKEPQDKDLQMWPFQIPNWKGCLIFPWLYSETYPSRSPSPHRISTQLFLTSLKHEQKAEFCLVFEESPQH